MIQNNTVPWLLLLIGLQSFALLCYCDRFWELKRPVKGKWLVYALLSVAVCVGVRLLCRYVRDTHMTYSFLYTLCLQIPLCLVLFHGNPYYKGLYVLFSNILYSIFLLLSLMSSVLLLPHIGKYFGTSATGMIMNLIFQCMAFVLLHFLQKRSFANRFYLSPPAPYWLSIYSVYILIYTGSVYVSDILIKRNLISVMSLVLETGLLLVCVAVFLLYIRVCRGYYEDVQHKLVLRQLSIQRAQFQEIQTSGEAMRKLRHELKNHMFYMKYLIDKRDIDELERYFQDFYQKEYHNLVEVSASGSILEAVLEQKLSVAREHGISLRDEILCALPEAISELDMCILLTNLLDNAIEACIPLTSAVITVRIRRVKEYLSVVVSNTVDRDVLRENPNLHSQKKNREIHGIGIPVIRELVGKYDGSIRFESDQGMFRASLMLRIGGDES